jgi:cob(I)alamin adenosyltransferase
VVKLTKIYTKTGDDGTTGLASGSRVRKDDPRVEAYGTVDESNAAIGVAVIAAEATGDETAMRIAGVLRPIQHDLFDLGADLATPVEPQEPAGSRLRIIPSQVTRLERSIDTYNDGLSPLTSFVLPGGTPLAAALHVARTVVRRAERLSVTLAARDPAGTNSEAIKYLNRLSDLLFVLSRVANGNGAQDVLWKPGATRGS